MQKYLRVVSLVIIYSSTLDAQLDRALGTLSRSLSQLEGTLKSAGPTPMRPLSSSDGPPIPPPPPPIDGPPTPPPPPPLGKKMKPIKIPTTRPVLKPVKPVESEFSKLKFYEQVKGAEEFVKKALQEGKVAKNYEAIVDYLKKNDMHPSISSEPMSAEFEKRQLKKVLEGLVS